MAYIHFNGQIIAGTELKIGPDNRAFNYGDGLFESIRVFKSRIPLLSYHVSRLLRDADRMGYALPATFNLEFIERSIRDLLERNAMSNARVKISLYRRSGGFYFPATDEVDCLMAASELASERLQLDPEGLDMTVYTGNLKAITPLSNMKTCNSLLYVLAGREARERKFDDAFIINQKGHFIESVSANMFIKLDSELITPPLNEGPLDGVLRQYLIDHLQLADLRITERAVDESLMNAAEEVLLTNAVQGVRWVAGYRGREFGRKTAGRITDALNKKWGL